MRSTQVCSPCSHILIALHIYSSKLSWARAVPELRYLTVAQVVNPATPSHQSSTRTLFAALVCWRYTTTTQCIRLSAMGNDYRQVSHLRTHTLRNMSKAALPKPER